MTRAMVIALALAACGGKQQTGGGGGSAAGSAVGNTDPVAHETPLEARRDAACKQLAPRLTSCAVEDAKADLAAGKVTQKQFTDDTAPGLLQKHTEKFIEECTTKRDYSSRQIRVLEVCFKEETECGPLRECLTNLQPKK